MSNLVKHLYIHIPFCNHICSYCDFARIQTQDQELKKQYVQKVVSELKKSSVLGQYQTVYIGGGTPNTLDDWSLTFLLENIKPYLALNYELSIECNPELVTRENVKIMSLYGVNRISLGVQTTNNQILKKINRHHTIEDVIMAINLFHQFNFENISVDFIYNLMDLTYQDLNDAIQFLIDYHIKHVSFYALEIKSGSLLKKLNIQIDESKAEDQLDYLIQKLEAINFYRYEVSNWCLDNQYQCQHNVNAYWKFHDWKAIGYGACGYEYWNNYEIKHQILDWQQINHFDSIHDYEISYLMMNLRLTTGLDLNCDYNQYLFRKYQSKLKYYKIINNHLVANDLSLLNQTIIDLFDSKNVK